jgi:ribosomal protein S12 methylthiotransferase
MAAANRQKPVTVGFVALGCPKNIVDSEKMLAHIAKAGFVVTTEPDHADVVVINTCGFIAPAKAEALDAVRHALRCKANGTIKKVIVAGCLPQRLGKELLDQTPGIDAIMGLGQRDNIAKIIKKTLLSETSSTFLGHFCRNVSDDRARLLIGPSHRAYLRISEGCSHSCSFCTIPAIRGRFRSKPPQIVLAEAAELASAGVVELNLIAQDTTSYGRDSKLKSGLTTLLTELDKIPMLKWIRLMYAYPAAITDELIETVAAGEKILHYLDIPIQHINYQILRKMRRPDTNKSIRQLIERLRKKVPDIVLRTTLIVGFPGETDNQFAELLEFVNWAKFDCLGCFPYYPEAGTPAAQMPDQLPDGVKQQRLKKLMLTQQKIAFEKNKTRIGTKLICLVDTVEQKKRLAKGRFYGQAPDIDSICIIKSCSAAPGRFIEAKVIGTNEYDLVIEPIYPPRRI